MKENIMKSVYAMEIFALCSTSCRPQEAKYFRLYHLQAWPDYRAEQTKNRRC